MGKQRHPGRNSSSQLPCSPLPLSSSLSMAWCPPVSLHEIQQELCSTLPNGVLKTGLKGLCSLWLFDLQWASLSLPVCLGLTGLSRSCPPTWMPSTPHTLCCAREDHLTCSPVLPFGFILLPGALWAQRWEEAGCGHVCIGVTRPLQPLRGEMGCRVPRSQAETQPCFIPRGQ